VFSSNVIWGLVVFLLWFLSVLYGLLCLVVPALPVFSPFLKAFFLIPLLTANTQSTPNALLAVLALVCLAFWLAFPRPLSGSLRRLRWPALGLLVFAVLSTAFSVNVHRSAMDLSMFLSAFVIFLVLATTLDNIDSIRIFFFSILLAGLGVGLAGIVILKGAVISSPSSGFYSTFSQADICAGFLLLIFPLAVSLFLCEEGVGPGLFYFIISFVSGGAMLLTLSRGGWIAGLLSLLVLLWNVRRLGAIRIAGRGFLLLAFILLFAWGVNGWARSGREHSPVATVSAKAAAIMEHSDPSRLARLAFWRGAVLMAGERPFLGSGLNSFGRVYPRHQENGRYFSNYVHNFYLRCAAEVGIPALLLVLWLLAGIFLTLGRGLSAAGRDKFVFAAMAGLISSLLASVFHVFVDVDWQFAGVFTLFCTEAAIGLALTDQLTADTDPGRSAVLPSGGMWTPFRLFLALLALLCIYPAINHFHAEFRLMHGLYLEQNSRIEQAWEEAQAAKSRDPWNTDAWHLSARLAWRKLKEDPGKKSLLVQAREDAARAALLDPCMGGVHNLLGKVLAAGGGRKEGEKELREAVRLDPVNAPGFYLDLAVFYRDSGRAAEAEKILRKAIGLYPDDVSLGVWDFRRESLKNQLSECLMALADLDARKRKIEEAVLLLERASQMTPLNPAPVFGKGVLLFRSGEWAASRDAFLKVEKLGTFPLNKLYLGESLLKTGDEKRGRALIEEAARLDPVLPRRIGK
jgi:tetratricopeptide (TPR) repeat protein